MSHDLPPTVWAGEFAAPQPLPKIGQATIPFTGSTEDNLPTPAFSPATADTMPAKLARPENVINRKWEAIIYFALAGVIIFPLLGVLAWRVIVHEREEWVSSYFPYLFSNVLFSLVFFGLLFGVTISALRWSKRVLYYALGGAGALLLLSLLVPGLTFYVPPARRLYFVVLLHNVLAGVALGVAVCALILSVRINQRAKAYLVSGAACAIIAMLLSYLYDLSSGMLYFFEGSRYWLVSASIGFVIGLIICGLRLNYKKV